MFHLAAYTGNAGIAAVNFDMTALADAELSQRNGHYILTEQYKLLSTLCLGNTLTEGSILCPSWNAIGRMNVDFPNSGTSFSSGQLADLRLGFEAMVPQREEIQYQTTNGAAGAAQNWGLLFLGTQQHSNKLPMPAPPGFNMVIRTTTTITAVANAWTGPGTLVFEQSLRGGVYSVVGANCTVTNNIAFRLIFPRNPLYNGRRLRPGNIPTIGTGFQQPNYAIPQARIFGEWGRFHTFEPPQVEILSNTAGAQTPTILLHLVFLGDYDDPLQGFTAQ